MSPDRKKPGAAFWAAVVVVVALAYPISFGPACWLTKWGYINSTISGRLYRPILRHSVGKDGRLASAIRCYALLDRSLNDYYLDTRDGIMDSMFRGK